MAKKNKQATSIEELILTAAAAGVKPGITFDTLAECDDDLIEEIQDINPVQGTTGYYRIPLGKGYSLNLGADADSKPYKTLPKDWNGVIQVMSGTSKKGLPFQMLVPERA
jgi:hypothetical protein